MAWIPALIAVAGMVADYFGNQSRQNQTSTSRTTQDFGPMTGLNDLAMRTIMQRLQGGLPAGYESFGLSGINSAFRGSRANLNNDLTSRGLATSPAAASALGGMDTARASQQGQFIAGEPMVRDARQMSALAPAMSLLGLNRGSTTFGTGAATGETGGGVGGAAQGLGSIIGMMYANGMFGRGSQPRTMSYDFGGASYPTSGLWPSGTGSGSDSWGVG